MEQQTRRIRRSVVTATKAVAVTKPSPDFKKLLKQIEINHIELVALQARQADLQAELFKQMSESDMTHAEYQGTVADITRSKGRASNVIDPKGFRKLVDEDVFYACIKVGSTEAKKHLTDVELKKVTTTTPGSLGDPQLVLSYASDKK